ncbi:4827_t:CDS:2, partial [Racocetra persica]
KDDGFSDIKSFQLSLFQFAKFWMSIFEAKGCKQQLSSHSYFKEPFETDNNNRILLNNNNRILKDYLNSAIKNYPGEYDFTDKIIEELTDATLKELYVDHWSIHSMTIEIIEHYYDFVNSQTIYNLFQNVLEAELIVEQAINKRPLKIIRPISISPTLERLRQLMAVINALDIISCDQDFWAEELIHTLEDYFAS